MSEQIAWHKPIPERLKLIGTTKKRSYEVRLTADAEPSLYVGEGVGEGGEWSHLGDFPQGKAGMAAAIEAAQAYEDNKP